MNSHDRIKLMQELISIEKSKANLLHALRDSRNPSFAMPEENRETTIANLLSDIVSCNFKQRAIIDQL